MPTASNEIVIDRVTNLTLGAGMMFVPLNMIASFPLRQPG